MSRYKITTEGLTCHKHLSTINLLTVINTSLVSLGRRICQLHLLRGVKPSQCLSLFDSISDGEALDTLRIVALENVKYSFIAITPKSTRNPSSSTYKDPIYVSNRTV